MIVKIYKTDIFQRVEILAETIKDAESCEVKSGMIHVKFNENMGSVSGWHFPVPVGFTRVELKEQ